MTSARGSLTLAAVRACGLTRPPRTPVSELRPRGRRHSRERDERAVRHHYDVNEFFALFLDDSMTYSCALFSRGAATLAQAQTAKRELVATKLGLREGEHILDVGCGWGASPSTPPAHGGVPVSRDDPLPRAGGAGPPTSGRGGLARRRLEIRVMDYRDLRARRAVRRDPPRSGSSST